MLRFWFLMIFGLISKEVFKNEKCVNTLREVIEAIRRYEEYKEIESPQDINSLIKEIEKINKLVSNEKSKY